MTARRTRLVRVPDLHTFRRVLVELAVTRDPHRAPSRIVIVPTRSAARQLRRTIADRSPVPELVTRDQFYDALYGRLPSAPPRLTSYERDIIMRAAARDASRAAEFRSAETIGPSLVTEMIRFYDQLRRQSKQVRRFEELLEETLSRDAEHDRGAARMLAQTRFLASAFHDYERRVAQSGACDEHLVRERLTSAAAADPVREIVVTVGDWIADANGLCLADFDLLTRLPGVDAIDIVATNRVLATGFQQRLHDWLPGIEEIHSQELGVGPSGVSRPVLLIPSGEGAAPFFTVRDREEELIAFVERLTRDVERLTTLDRSAVVFKRPLPYLYLAREVFKQAGVAYETSDALPLAAEPFAAALDLVFEFLESGFTREAIVALLRSPHFCFSPAGRPIPREAISRLDRALSDARYLGGLDRLAALASSLRERDEDQAGPAAQAAYLVAERLSPLLTPAPASDQLRILQLFLSDCGAADSSGDTALVERLRRGRMAVMETLGAFEHAHRRHDDSPMAIGALASSIRKKIEEQTFEPDGGSARVQLLDDQAVRYGDFDDVALVGLIESDWPERPRRNLFYSSTFLTSLGWPSEKDRRAAAAAHFVDLLASSHGRVSVSTVSLDEETLVEPSMFLDEIPTARLETTTVMADTKHVFTEESWSEDWAGLRQSRPPATSAAFHGFVKATGLPPVHGEPFPSAWSVSAVEVYLACPFKFFAQHVLRLEEEPDDEEVMDPRSQGQFVHRVFEAFFEQWQANGHLAITPANLEAARTLFAHVVEQQLASLSATEAALERTRLLGSSAAAGLGEAVLRMEADRPIPVVSRCLEHGLKGDFVFNTPAGRRSLPLKGKADRIDLLADGTFRLIDYKLGWPPNKTRAVQLPIYALCAEQHLHGYLGRAWTLGEAVYLAFKGPKRVVPLFTSVEERAKVLGAAQERVVAAVDAIARGEFPPRPDDVHRCETCSYEAVCRKDYVGDV